MQDHIQQFANLFCGAFGFKDVTIGFAVDLSKRDMNVYNILMSPTKSLKFREKWWARNISALSAMGLHATTEKYLLNVAENTNFKTYVSEIEEGDLKVLRAAIDLCENPAKGELELRNLKKELADEVREVAGRIRKFHAEGKAIQLFKDLFEIVAKERGKMPLIESHESDLVHYEHEAIHYILRRQPNPLWFAGKTAFNEGLCTFLHMRYSGGRTYGMYHGFSGNRQYLGWSRFFSEKFANKQPPQIGWELKSNPVGCLREFEMSPYH